MLDLSRLGVQPSRNVSESSSRVIDLGAHLAHEVRDRSSLLGAQCDFILSLDIFPNACHCGFGGQCRGKAHGQTKEKSRVALLELPSDPVP